MSLVIFMRMWFLGLVYRTHGGVLKMEFLQVKAQLLQGLVKTRDGGIKVDSGWLRTGRKHILVTLCNFMSSRRNWTTVGSIGLQFFDDVIFESFVKIEIGGAVRTCYRLVDDVCDGFLLASDAVGSGSPGLVAAEGESHEGRDGAVRSVAGQVLIRVGPWEGGRSIVVGSNAGHNIKEVLSK
jgi:hypothetical protein